MTLNGQTCACTLTAEAITLSGNFYRYDIHKRVKVSGGVTVDLLNVLRVGATKTYSRLMLAIPMCLGFLALFIRGLPVLGILFPVIPDVYYVGPVFWRIPFQVEAWKLCAVLCLLTIPLYWLSYRSDLEINTTKGRYLLPRKGMGAAQIAAFQQEFTQAKAARQTAQRDP